METLFKVIYTGVLLPGFNYEDVASNLISISGMDREKAMKFLLTEKPKLIKRDLNREKAQKYQSIFTKAGLQVKLMRVQGPKEESAPPISVSQVNNTGTNQISDTKEKEREPNLPNSVQQTSPPENPYASPRADLEVDRVTSESQLEEPQKVPASHGWLWIKKGVTLFFAHPWKWMGMAFVACLILILINMIPLIGIIPYCIVSMIFAGGLTLAAQNQDNGEDLKFSDLFKGFSHNRNQLIIVGLLYLGGFVVIGIVMVVIIGSSIWGIMGVGPGDSEAVFSTMTANIPMFILAVLAGMALYIPLLMAIWFSPALVAINDCKAWPAYKLSLKACLRNILPFLVYGLAFLVIGLLLMAGMGVVSGLLAFFLSSETSFLFALLPMLIMSLLGFPLMVVGGLSVFTCFKDIFYTST